MNFTKIIRVAGPEFASTAMTKGFIIGALVVPAVMAALIPLIAILSAAAQPSADKGTVYILDRSTEVFTEIETRLSPEEVRARWEARAQRAANFAKGMMGQSGSEQVENAMSFIKTPEFRIIPTAQDADIEEIKTEIRDQLESGNELDDPMDKVLAVIEIDIDAANIDALDVVDAIEHTTGGRRRRCSYRRTRFRDCSTLAEEPEVTCRDRIRSDGHRHGVDGHAGQEHVLDRVQILVGLLDGERVERDASLDVTSDHHRLVART
jgi:hypothetical protein